MNEVIYVVTWRFLDGSGNGILCALGRESDAQEFVQTVDRIAHGMKLEIQEVPVKTFRSPEYSGPEPPEEETAFPAFPKRPAGTR